MEEVFGIGAIKYRCQICNEIYRTIQEALECENKPIINTTGVKPGDSIYYIEKGIFGTVKKLDVINFGQSYQKGMGIHSLTRFDHHIIISFEDENKNAFTQVFHDEYQIVNDANIVFPCLFDKYYAWKLRMITKNTKKF